MKNVLCGLLAVVALASCQTTSQTQSASGEFTTAHLPLSKYQRNADCCTAQGKEFAVASPGFHGSQAAIEISKKGCNIVDAAIAASFVIAVERPHSTGIGGGGFLTLFLSGKHPVAEFVDFRESAPGKAKPDMYLKDGQLIENLSRDGVHAAGTPGFVAGHYDIYRKYGSKKAQCSWQELLGPAIRLAEEGFSVYPSLSERIDSRKDILLKDPEATKLLFRNGKPLKVGDVLVQKDLGQTLRTIAATGKKDFYEGALAKKIASFIHSKAMPGVAHVTANDLKKYRTLFKKPLEGQFGNFRVYTAGLPSAGGVTLIESLNILSGYNLAGMRSQPEYLHLLSEVLLRSFADRTLLGDVRSDRTYEKLLTPGYADAVRKSLATDKATQAKSLRPGNPQQENPHTAHASLMDGDGNAVGVTTTVNFYFGAAVMVPGTGIFLNDEMDDFATKVGGTNISGLPASAPNAIAPYKRPISSMIPTIVVEDGKPVLVAGAAGSSTIVTGVLQVLLNHLVLWPNDTKRAVFAGRIHKQFDPNNDILTLESDAFSRETESALKEKGHRLEPAKFSPQVHAVGYNPATGVMTAVHEPRDHGGAAAF